MVMMCIACGDWSTPRVCASCLRSLHPAPDRSVNGVAVRSAFVHEGAARRLVHRLKYEGSRPAARILAGAMADLLPAAGVLVPVPRVLVRRWALGADGGVMLASALARTSGRCIERRLRAPVWQPPHAGRPRAGRQPPRLGSRAPVGGAKAVLVDDVVTTGATIAAAMAALHSRGGDAVEVVAVVCATSATEVTSV